MVRGAGKNGKSGKAGEDEEGPGLWKAYTRDIARLDKNAPPDSEVPVKKPVKKPTRTAPASSAPATPKPSLSPSAQQAPQLDARTDQRLRRGQVPLEGTLDLHGMTQQEAHTTLNDYILKAHARKKRCLLVITGKGRVSEGGGVLKQKLPQWLSMAPLKDVVLKIYPAVRGHGGTGAWYVYLKRHRDY